ncbi:MAG: transcription elongation factor GreA [SAR202 cluster bacterium]|nr:transcription elongation factor GreA [SAR202 cluster bacterium]
MARKEVHKENYLTKEGLKHLEDELRELKQVRRPEVAERINQASQSGGTLDNAEYEEAKNEQSFIEGRIRDLEAILSDAVVAPKEGGVKGAVKIGSSVTMTGQDGAKRKYVVVGSAEAAPLEGRISNESPVGQALMGKKVGDKIQVKTPSGVHSFTITRVA